MKFARNDKFKTKAQVEMTPLIDVVFQLLIFFLLSSTFVVQTSIPIEVSEAEGVEQLEQKEMSITLQYGEGGPDNGGPVILSQFEDIHIHSWGELTQFLTAFHDERPEALVLIRPDARIPTGRTIKVLGILNSVGIHKYGVMAQPPQEEE